MQGFAFAANVRNDGPHCSMVAVARRSGYGPEALVRLHRQRSGKSTTRSEPRFLPVSALVKTAIDAGIYL